MRRLPVITIAIAGVGLAALELACASRRTPVPRYVAQPTSALERVPYPPPPARVEIVPASPSPDAVWIDGEWRWRGRRYAWRPGRWVVPPPNASFAPWTDVRGEAGTLFLAEGVFRDPRGRAVPDPRPLAMSTPNVGAVTNPEGEKTGSEDIGLPADSGAPLEGRGDAAFDEATLAPPELIVDAGFPMPRDASEPDAAEFPVDASIDATPLRPPGTMGTP